MTLAAAVILFFVAAAQLSPSGWFDLPSVMIVVVGCHLALKFSAAHNACQCLAGRRQSGELELLLTTPLEGEKVVRGSAISLKRQLIWPVLFVIAMDCALMIVGWHKDGFWEGMPWAFLMLVEVVWFFANLYSLTLLGMCLGLKCASHAKALGRTLFYVMFMPWSGLALVAVVIGVCTMGKSFAGPMTLVMIVEFFVLVALCNLGFAGWAGGELRDRFRLLAAENFLHRANEGNEEKKPKGRELLIHTFKELLNGLRG
jgi:hypothetical protein